MEFKIDYYIRLIVFGLLLGFTSFTFAQLKVDIMITGNIDGVIIETVDNSAAFNCHECERIEFIFGSHIVTGVKNAHNIDFFESGGQKGQFTFKRGQIEYISADGSLSVFRKLNDHTVSIIYNDISINLNKIGDTYTANIESLENSFLPFLQVAVLLGFHWI